MEVGVEVWLKDNHGNESWIPGFVHAKVYPFDIVISIDADATYSLGEICRWKSCGDR